MTEPLVPVDTVGAFMGAPALLAAGDREGALWGTTAAVKDLFDVAGTITWAGNPDFGRLRTPARRHAAAVNRLVEAGVTVVGRTITDELAFSLSGTNVHFGTPLNPAAPDRIPGGSSAGSASAVAAGLVDVGVGTDTAGSIRIPASYCGLWGWRPTHGRVPVDGLVPLAPSFDTVGLLASDPSVLARCAAVMVDGPDTLHHAAHARYVVVAEALEAVDDRVAEVVRAWARGADADIAAWGVSLDGVLTAQRRVQLFEAWQTHGEWITGTQPTMGPGISARFAAASQVDTTTMGDAMAQARRLIPRLRAPLIGDTAGTRTVFVLPAAAGPAPLRCGGHDAEALRTANLRLTCTAGLAGLPVVVAPFLRLDDLPLGLAFVGAPGADLWLIERIAALHRGAS